MIVSPRIAVTPINPRNTHDSPAPAAREPLLALPAIDRHRLDISKAFDSVSWSFIVEILGRVGFGRRWIDLICLILSTTSTQVLVNGVLGDTIFHHRGLRQCYLY